MQHGAFDNESKAVMDSIYQDIGLQLFEEWNNSNLDEGQYYADFQIAYMSNNNYIKDRFNQFYDLNPEHDDYLEAINVD